MLDDPVARYLSKYQTASDPVASYKAKYGDTVPAQPSLWQKAKGLLFEGPSATPAEPQSPDPESERGYFSKNFPVTTQAMYGAVDWGGRTLGGLASNAGDVIPGNDPLEKIGDWTREKMDAFSERTAPQSTPELAGRVGSNIVTEGASYILGGMGARKLAGRATQEVLERIAPKVASKLAGKGALQEIVKDAAAVAPLDLVATGAGPENSTVGALAQLTEEKYPRVSNVLEELAENRATRFGSEVLIGGGADAAIRGFAKGAKGARNLTGRAAEAVPQLRRRVAEIADPSIRTELTTAYTDEATGLPSQRAFDSARARLDADPAKGVTVFDLTNSKAINDDPALGWDVGTQRRADVAQVIREEAEKLGLDVRDAFRAGGDEFAVYGPPDVLEQLGESVKARVPDMPAQGTVSGIRYGVGTDYASAEAAAQAAKATETAPKYRGPLKAGPEGGTPPEAGAVLPEIPMALGRTAVGATAGGLLAPEGEKAEGMAVGAGLGLAGPAAVRGLRKMGRGGFAVDPIARGLPMDEASRMARAADQGYTKDVYHGTGSPDIREMRPSSVGEFGPSVYTTTSPAEASSYAGARGMGGQPNVLPLRARLQNPLVVESVDEFWNKFPEAKTDADAIRMAVDAGYDGVVYPRPVEVWDDAAGRAIPTGETQEHVMVFDPANIRSRFAKFDPANVGKPDLLGAASPELTGAIARTGAGALAGGAAASQEGGLTPAGGALAGAVALGAGPAVLRRLRGRGAAVDDVAEPVARQAVPEPPKPPKPPARPVQASGEQRVVSLRKEEGKAIRERLGLDELPAPHRQSFEEVWDEALDQGMSAQAIDVARSAAASKRSLTPVEHAAAVQRFIDLDNELRESHSILEAAENAGNDVVAAREVERANRLLEDIDVLTEATDRTGTEAGRALSVRRLRANADDYTVARGFRLARSRKGKALTPQERATIDAETRTVEKLQKENERLVAQNEKIAAERDEAIAASAVRAESSKNRLRGRGNAEKLAAERSDLLKQLAEIGYRLNDVTGVSAKGLELIGKLAANHIRTAVSETGERITLDIVTKRVLSDLNNPEISARDVREALANRSPKRVQKARSEAQQHVTELKAQARVLAEIEDAAQMIFPTSKKASPRSALMEKLRGETKELRARSRALSKVEAAEKGVFQKSPRPAVRSDALQALQARLRELRTKAGLEIKIEAAKRGVFPSAKKPSAPAEEIQSLQKQLDELRAKAKLEAKVEAARRGVFPESRKPTVRPPELDALQRELDDLRTQEKLKGQIADTERGILPPARKPREVSDAVKALRSRLTELRSAAYKTIKDGQRLETALKSIDELQDQLSNGYRKMREQKTVRELPPELADAREKISGLRREMRTEDTLADIQEQLRTGDFKIPEKREPGYVSPQLERNQIALRRARRKWRQAISDMAPPSARRKVAEGAAFLRTMKATADMSATLRQGFWLSVRRPGTALDAFGKSAKAMFSEHSAERINNAIREHPNQLIRDRAGLELTDVGGALHEREEFFASQIAENLPVFGAIVRASDRAMSTTLNLLRTAAFDQFLTANPNATLGELKAWANWVNVASGRGDLGRARAIGTELSTVIFAPRFAASRIQTPFMVFKHWKEPRVRREIAKDYAAVVGLGMTTLALAEMAGFEVGVDPRESDFGKIRIGDTRIDIWAGVQQPVRLLARVVVGVTDRAGLTGTHLTDAEKEVDPLELLGRFAAFKLAPSVTVPLALYRGKDAVGEPVTPTQTAVRAVLPLLYEDVLDAYRAGGASAAGLSGAAAFVGVGASTYGDSEAATRRKARKLADDGQTREAWDLITEWNKKNPDDPIKTIGR